MSRVTEFSDEESPLEEPKHTTGGGDGGAPGPSKRKTKRFIYGGAAAGAVLGVLIFISSTGVSAAISSPNLPYLLLAAVVGAGTGALVGLGIARRHQIRDFYHGVKLEMARATWPTRSEVWGTTVVVLIAMFFFGFYLWGVDKVVTLGFEALEKAIR